MKAYKVTEGTSTRYIGTDADKARLVYNLLSRKRHALDVNLTVNGKIRLTSTADVW